MPEYPTNPKYGTRHYEDLAAFIKTALLTGLDKEVESRVKHRVAERLADRLAKDNPEFDRERFLKACGVEG